MNGIVYQGTYGPWTVDSSDVREVLHLHFLLLLLSLPILVFKSLHPFVSKENYSQEDFNFTQFLWVKSSRFQNHCDSFRKGRFGGFFV